MARGVAVGGAGTAITEELRELPYLCGLLVDRQASGWAMIGPEMLDTTGGQTPAPTTEEPRGCLFALSQPPLMIFLTVIGVLLLIASVHDLFLL